MATKTNIVNMALGHLAISTQVSNADTEISKEAKAARTFFEIAKDSALSEFPWPFAKKRAPLALVENNPNEYWNYSYRYPSDCFYILEIESYLNPNTNRSKINYEINGDSSGQVLFCNEANAGIQYIYKHNIIEQWPSDFVLALSYLLAHLIAPQLTGGDPYKLGAQALSLYRVFINKAKKRSANEEVKEEQPMSDLEESRY